MHNVMETLHKVMYRLHFKGRTPPNRAVFNHELTLTHPFLKGLAVVCFCQFIEKATVHIEQSLTV
jgi:hypothetical protein